MTKLNNIDPFDEALRIIFLEASKDVGETDVSLEMNSVLAFNEAIMKEDRYEDLIARLSSITAQMSFGQLLQQTIDGTHVTEVKLAEAANLPPAVIENLKADSMYTNNVPIVLFRNLLTFLNIPYNAAEKAIRKTFEIIQRNHSFNREATSVLIPAFRKGPHSSRESVSRSMTKGDGKELFENEEALQKYLSRLNELMK